MTREQFEHFLAMGGKVIDAYGWYNNDGYDIEGRFHQWPTNARDGSLYDDFVLGGAILDYSDITLSQIKDFISKP
jgi:hypothetical protein